MFHNRIDDLLTTTACYRSGALIGPVTGVYVQEDSGHPVWAAVGPGMLLPLCRAVLAPGRRLVVDLPPRAVEAAPQLPPGAAEIRIGLDDALFAHYASALSPVSGPWPVAVDPRRGAGRVACRRHRAG